MIELIYSLICMGISLVARKIASHKLPPLFFYIYALIFFLVVTQFYSIAFDGSPTKSGDIGHVMFFDDVFNDILPNAYIELLSFIMVIILGLFCFPKKK